MTFSIHDPVRPLPDPLTWRTLQRHSARERCCFVCRQNIEPGTPGSVFHADLVIYTHGSPCYDIANSCRRIFDRSPRGRWRSTSEALEALFARHDPALTTVVEGHMPVTSIQDGWLQYVKAAQLEGLTEEDLSKRRRAYYFGYASALQVRREDILDRAEEFGRFLGEIAVGQA